eukprot:9470077-Pyramimonas_sp.AAC.1
MHHARTETSVRPRLHRAIRVRGSFVLDDPYPASNLLLSVRSTSPRRWQYSGCAFRNWGNP